MERWRERELREEYLLLLWNKQKACNFGGSTSNKELCEELGIEFNGPAVQICKYLKGKGWIEWPVSFAWITLTQAGREKAEEMDNQRFEAKEERVLETLREARNTHPNGVTPDELALAVNFELRDVYDVIKELERKDWIGGSDERVWIIPAGIKELERLPNPSTPQIHIHQPHNSPMQFGSFNTQQVAYNNQPISDILPQLTALIEKVRSESFPDRDEVLQDLQKAQEVALANPSAISQDAVWTRIVTKLNAAKTTMEIAGFVIQTYPYWPQIIDFFNQNIR